MSSISIYYEQEFICDYCNKKWGDFWLTFIPDHCCPPCAERIYAMKSLNLDDLKDIHSALKNELRRTANLEETERARLSDLATKVYGILADCYFEEKDLEYKTYAK